VDAGGPGLTAALYSGTLDPMQYSPVHVSGRAAMTDDDADEVIPAQGAGVPFAVTHLAVTCAHASTGTKVELRSGTTVLMRQFAAANGGGWKLEGTPENPIFVTEPNEPVTARCVTDESDVDVFVSGVTAP
jgi:hypothetical protein